jgi:hypothetical protein
MGAWLLSPNRSTIGLLSLFIPIILQRYTYRIPIVLLASCLFCASLCLVCRSHFRVKAVGNVHIIFLSICVRLLLLQYTNYVRHRMSVVRHVGLTF